MKNKNCGIILAVFLTVLQSRGLAMEIKSEAFKEGQTIPAAFTCQGQDINPALQISGIPAEAKSLALIVDDPDAPGGTWVHWLLYDIPVATEIKQDSVPGKQGINSGGKGNYHGPCPPSGTHRYFFKLYALDKMLDLKENLTRQELEKAISPHILAQAQLMGVYKKSR